MKESRTQVKQALNQLAVVLMVLQHPGEQITDDARMGMYEALEGVQEVLIRMV